MYRRKALPWLAILLLSFALRLIHLEGRDLWYDEAFAVLYASMSPERMIYGTVGPMQGAGAADVHPLLYYSLLHSWMALAGRSPLAVRFLSVALGMVTVALLVRMAAWSFDRRTGLVVGLLAATNPFHVAYSQEARMYALLGLAAVAAAWGLLRALGEAGGRGQEAGGRRQEAGGRRQEAGGRRREAGGRRQEAGGGGEEMVPLVGALCRGGRPHPLCPQPGGVRPVGPPPAGRRPSPVVAPLTSPGPG
jgi:hypothetical protein